MSLKRNLLMLTVIMLSLTSCSLWKNSKKEPASPPTVWTVKANEPSTPYYDGICGRAGEWLLIKR